MNQGLPRHIIKAMRETAAEIVDLKKQLFELQTFMCVLIHASPDEKVLVPVQAIKHITTLGITDIVVDANVAEGHIELSLARDEPKDSTILRLT